jgi:hypothetical protein
MNISCLVFSKGSQALQFCGPSPILQLSIGKFLLPRTMGVTSLAYALDAWKPKKRITPIPGNLLSSAYLSRFWQIAPF